MHPITKFSTVLATALVLTTASGAVVSTSAEATPPESPPVNAVARAERPPVPAVPERYLKQQLAWHECWFTTYPGLPPAPTGMNPTQCAEVKVPLDWHHPEDHPDITVSIAYSKASGTSKGLLTANPGGPGAAAAALPYLFATLKPQIQRDFDLLGMDPRGTSMDRRTRCMATAEELAAIPAVDDLKDITPNTFPHQEAMGRLIAEKCAKVPEMPFINTQQTVYDMDLARRLLGAPTLHYYGISYGTWLGAYYADTYPEHTGRMVLDSNMSFTEPISATFDGQPPAFQARRDFSFYPWLSRHDDKYHFGTTVTEVWERYNTLRATLADLHKRDRKVMAPTELDRTLSSMLYGDEEFPAAGDFLARTLAYTQNPTPRETAELLQSPSQVRQPRFVGSPRVTPGQKLQETHRQLAAGEIDRAALVEIAGVFEIVACNDSTWSTNMNLYRERWLEDSARYPFKGWDNDMSMCAFWPRRVDADRRITLQGAPKILMLQNEGDPATSYAGALDAHNKLRSGTRLISVNDQASHGVWAAGYSTCAATAADDFLFNGHMPERDVVCGTKPLPLDSKVFRFPGLVTGGTPEESAPAH